jgi:hypothetical protein
MHITFERITAILLYMETVNHPASTEQSVAISAAIHEVKLQIAQKIAAEMDPILTFLYRAMPDQRPRDIVSPIYDCVVTHAWPQVYVDYSRLLICQGDLAPASQATVTMNPSFVGFSWENNSSDRNAHYSDRAVLIAYCDALGLFCFTVALYTRNLKEARLNIEKFDGYEIQTWMSFISAEGTKLANSVYTGKLKEWGDWSNPDYDGEGLIYKVPDSEPAADATYIDPINETAVPKRATPTTPIIPIKKVIVPDKATPKAIHKVKHGMATNLANQMEYLLTFVYRYPSADGAIECHTAYL